MVKSVIRNLKIANFMFSVLILILEIAGFVICGLKSKYCIPMDMIILMAFFILELLIGHWEWYYYECEKELDMEEKKIETYQKAIEILAKVNTYYDDDNYTAIIPIYSSYRLSEDEKQVLTDVGVIKNGKHGK